MARGEQATPYGITSRSPSGHGAVGAAPDGASDVALMTALQQGDRGALASLYDRHAPQLLGLAWRILGNRGDAEDLIHDVFLEAWNKAASFDPGRGSVRAWLVTRVRSRAIDRLRVLGTARRHAMAETAAAPEEPAALEDPSHAPDRRRARDALAGLPEEQRTVIELAYFEGLTCREIGDRCGIPVGTVKSRMSAAIGKLRAGLAPRGEDS